MAAAPIIANFPTELKQCLLSALPDIHSLRSMTLSCSSFYHAYKSAESLITSQVFQNQFEVEVLPEAVTALKSSRVLFSTRPHILDFSHGLLRSRTAPTESWTLSAALPLSKLQLSVEYFATGFIAETLNKSSALDYIDNAPPPWPVSRAERNRIHRAFYRFEIYCNLFREFKLFRNDDQGQVFFSRFSYWENEQLACVHDYLFRAVCPGASARDEMCDLQLTMAAFNEATEHDDCAQLELESIDVVGYGDDHNSPYIEHILSLGLESLQQIVTAQSPKTRYSLLGGKTFPCPIFNFLAEGLESSNERTNRRCLGDYTQAQNEEIARFRPPFVAEPDTGPADAWRWAHENHTSEGFVYSSYHKALRARGYCLWDLARLVAWPAFHQEWQQPPEPLSDDEKMSRRGEMQQRVYWRKSYGPGSRK